LWSIASSWPQAIALARQVALAAGDHGQNLVRGRGGLLDGSDAERSARTAHDGFDALVVGRRWQAGDLVAVSDPGDTAAQG
jgi:hypothetical protein